MCTASWTTHREDDGYDLLFNRDERRTRGRAYPPEQISIGGVAALAPTDSDHGGTWIGVNALGVALCVQNRYQDDGRPFDESTAISRGVLARSLLDSPSIAAMEARLADSPLDRFRPFDLVTFEPGSDPRLSCWTGSALQQRRIDGREMPLVSSSYRLPDVERARRACFEDVARGAGPVDVARLVEYHMSHLPERGPLSPCMHRPDAQTVSFTWITVGPRAITLRYADGAPCEAWSRRQSWSICRESL